MKNGEFKEKEETVLSCPFCGSTEVELCRTNPNACWVRCASCGAEANTDPSRVGAINNWNSRFEACEAKIVDDDERR